MNTPVTAAPADITAAGGKLFRIDGMLDFDTVPLLLKQAHKLFAASDTIQLDFAGVTGCNSAGLALVLEMAREMKRQNKSIQYLNIPQQIRTFAEAYAVADELESAGLLTA